MNIKNVNCRKIFFSSMKIKRRFTSNPNIPTTEDKIVYNSLYLSDKNMLPYLITLPHPPINLFSNTTKKLERKSFILNHYIEKFILSNEIKLIQEKYLGFLKALVNYDEKYLENNLEGNVYKQTINFLDKFQYSKFKFQIFEPKNIIFQVVFLSNQGFQGVFIERFLNYEKREYFIKETKFTKIYEKNPKSSKVVDFFKIKKENLLHDEILNPENLESLRNSYKIQEVLVDIYTNICLNIYDKKEDKLIYGNLDPKILEVRKLKLENKHLTGFNKIKKFIITDIDEILGGNPHSK